jgi:anaerobic ribonucleoside-triphosphate reductase activating protein
MEALGKDYITGLSILGGEPFEEENKGTVQKILEDIRDNFPNKSVWCYSGFTYEELVSTSRKILEKIDVLVDGAFEVEKRNLRLKFRGSENQRIIDVQKSLKSGMAVGFEV